MNSAASGNQHTMEVLAPAGSPEALTAAVRCGAAAVYLGVDAFNARQAAHNFTIAELPDTVAYCHSRNTAVHLTLNTLLRQDELPAAIDVAVAACQAGVDALIVQDVGLARRLHAIMPTMPLHASTQLSCHTPAGVQFLKEAGFSRVVLSREMSREEILACTGRGIELEVFVHGALCMSVSGQCYFSAMLGGRSGNRGQCAQPCRLPFAPTGETHRPAGGSQGALSLRDQCLVSHVKELADMGIASLKIEGRMKRPEYVAAATTVYTAAVQGETVSPDRLEALQRIFSRSGFTDGYFTAHRGREMFGIRRKEDVTAATGILGNLQRLYDRETARRTVTMQFAATADKATLTAIADNGCTVTVQGGGAEMAAHRPLDTERAVQQLQKTGGTPFRATDIQVTVPPQMTLPTSQLNAMRREALDKLEAKLGQTVPVPHDKTAVPMALPSHRVAASPRRYVRLANHRQWQACRQVDRVFLPLFSSLKAIAAIADTGQAVGVEIPRGMFGQEESIRTALRAAKEAGADAALCGNIGALPLAIEADLTPIGGFGLNLFNEEALAFYKEHGLAEATLSIELPFSHISALQPPLPIGLFLYGRQPLMLTRNCPRQSALNSCQGCHGQGITDRTGTAFPVMCAGGCSEVLNSVPLYWGDKLKEIPAVDFLLFHFTTETTEETAAVLAAYEKGAPPPPAITRGLYRRGVL